MKTLTSWLVVILIALIAGSAVAAQDQAPAPATLTGPWTMAASTAQGDAEFRFDLVQDGVKMVGTLFTPHGEVVLEGELVDGTLKLASSEPITATLTAKVGDDGALAGSMTSEMGDVTFTAKREKR